MPSVAVIIIGREILTGKFADENGPFFIEQLRVIGADLQRLVTVDDDRAAIADEVRRCAAQFDHVITTGGVGPTHDDVTLESIARAFDRELVLAAPLVELMERFQIAPTDANLRMAKVPQGSRLVDTESGYPVVRCENVWVLPGVPKLVRRKFPALAPFMTGSPLHTHRLFLDVHETDIAQALTEAAERHPTVDIGSYPRFDEGPKVILTLETTNAEALARAVADLKGMFDLRGQS